ncbi:MAG: AmmeMemoRadiSam system protein B [Candidatus Bipolaricaulota bacterium]
MEKVLGPVVAGKFYPEEREELIERIEECYRHQFGPGKLPARTKEVYSNPVGLIAPHAGYRFSGPIAAQAYHWLAELGSLETVVVVGTNHSGMGPAASIIDGGEWVTPLGRLEIDRDLAGDILEASEKLERDYSSFSREHSIEVQLPFLQHLWGSDFSFVPICLKDQGRKVAEDVSDALLEETPPGTLLIASTDFSHYELQKVAEEKDERAIKSIMDGDLSKLYDDISEYGISICGYGAIAVLLSYTRKQDLKPHRLKYATSGEVSGYGREVVGYSAIGFS